MDNLLKHKVMLIYPPCNSMFQRGEDRCQANIDESIAVSPRACNDLGYGAASLINAGFDVMLKDYQNEKLQFSDLVKDIECFEPEVIFISTTNASIFEDIEIINKIKSYKNDIVIILKGAIFYNPDDVLLSQLDLSGIDYLIGGESDFILPKLVSSHFNNMVNIELVNGILYKKNGKFLKTKFDNWDDNLDDLPFPNRDLMNNKLYLRPDTQEIQATISTSRGCPSSCIFCLTPVISGKKFRMRSAKNVLEELLECYEKYNIKNFFFKADTFTYDKKWTKELCNLIIESKLNGQISWVANSRVNTIDEEILRLMKKAGCWLVAFGFESGSQKTLDLIKKGTTVEQNVMASKLAKEVGLKIYGFYMVGFPWENKEDLKETEKLIYKLNSDFIEIHIATPFYGTEFYNIVKNNNLMNESVLGNDYFASSIINTKYLSAKDIKKFRQKVMLQYHMRFSYVFNKIISSILKPKIILNYFKYGFRLLKNALTRR